METAMVVVTLLAALGTVAAAASALLAYLATQSYRQWREDRAASEPMLIESQFAKLESLPAGEAGITLELRIGNPGQVPIYVTHLVLMRMDERGGMRFDRGFRWTGMSREGGPVLIEPRGECTLTGSTTTTELRRLVAESGDEHLFAGANYKCGSFKGTCVFGPVVHLKWRNGEAELDGYVDVWLMPNALRPDRSSWRWRRRYPPPKATHQWFIGRAGRRRVWPFGDRK